MKEMCTEWVEVLLFVEKYYQDTKLANRTVHIFNDNAMMHLRKILQNRQNNSHWTSSLLKRLGKYVQRKKNQLRVRDREGKKRQ